MDSILQFGVNLVTQIQSLGGWLELPMKFFSFLGTEYFFLLALPLLYWSLDAKLGIRVGMILLVGDGLNGIFKLLFAGPRPYWVSPNVKAFAAETSFGVPSGHAQIATGVWGIMAGYLKKTWAWIVAGLIIFLIGLSRLYLGVHFPHDVLLGWLIGGLLLWAFLSQWGRVAGWLKRQTFWTQVLIALGVSLTFILLAFLARLRLGDYQVPADWLANAARAGGDLPDPAVISGTVSTAGVFFGLALGLALLAPLGGYRTDGVWWKRALRFVLGLVGVLILWQGLGMLLPDGETLLPLALRYLRYALVGLWVSAGAPWIFWLTRLAEKHEPRKAHLKRAAPAEARTRPAESKRAAPRK